MPQIDPRAAGQFTQTATNNLGALCQTLLDYQRDLQGAMLSGDWSKVAQLQMQRQTELFTVWTQAVTSMAGPMGDYWRSGMMSAIESWQKTANGGLAGNMAEQTERLVDNMKSATRPTR